MATSPLKLEYTNSPSFEDLHFLTERINEISSKLGMTRAEPFAFFARDDNEKIIAGVSGSIIYGEIYTDQLWVKSDLREQGLGKYLMQQVHELGLKNHCAFATVYTMRFQGAKGFYESLGYAQDFQRSGYEKNSTCIFMRKNLI